MKKLLIMISCVMLPTFAASSQTAHINISVPDSPFSGLVYQSLDKYSIVDSLALDENGAAQLDVECRGEFQFFRLVLGRDKLPMILHGGEQVSVTVNSANILESKVTGSPDTEYLLNGLLMDDKPLRKIMKRNPASIANIFLADRLDPDKDIDILKEIIEKNKVECPALDDLRDRVEVASRLRSGAILPDFQIPDLDGKMVDTRDLRGESLLIVFWATWSKESCDYIDGISKTLGPCVGKPARRLLISMDGDRDLLMKASKKYADSNTIILSYLNYFDNEVARMFRITKMPMAIFVDSSGRIIQVLR